MWAIVEMLQRATWGVSVAAMIEETGASKASVYRDLKTLRAGGVPIDSETVNGEARYRLGGQPLPALAPTVAQLSALVLARQLLSSLEGLRLVDELDALLRRWSRYRPEDSSPSTLGAAADAADDAVELAPMGRATRPDETRTLEAAIRRRERVSFTYRGADDASARERLVDPVVLRVHKGATYLIAFDLDRKDWRVFKMARIVDVATCGAAEEHAAYDEAALFAYSAGVWTGEPIDVAVRIRAEAAHLLREYCLRDSQTVEVEPDGCAIVRAQVAGIVEPMRWVLGWGANATVLAPAELRDRVRGELRTALGGYIQ